MADSLRLDVALYNQGLAASRSRAGSYIEAGLVYVNGKSCAKASYRVSPSDVLEVRGGEDRFVSRGGYKLLKALETFPIDLQGKICMDVGASTGGFTHCMLQHGAGRVWSVDVGTDQLAECLRQDPRVMVREQCNFRYATKKEIPDPIDFASVDVSFISLTHILPVLHTFLQDGGQAVCLIKPQFEAGRQQVGKNGVVKDAGIHVTVIKTLLSFLIQQDFSVLGLTHSPIKGPQGNIEYLVWIQKGNGEQSAAVDPCCVVQKAHQELDGESA